MNPPILFLAQNLILPFAVVFAFGLLLRWRGSEPLTWQIVTGIVFALGGLAAMQMPFEFAPGIVIDNRIALVAIAGLFGGPVPAVIAAIAICGYRFHIGGAGALTGIACIICAAMLGALVRWRWRRAGRAVDWRASVVVAIGTVLVTLPWTLALPDAARPWDVLTRIAAPIAIIYPVSTLVLAGLLLLAEHHQQVVDNLRSALTGRAQAQAELATINRDLEHLVEHRTLELDRARAAAEDANKAKGIFLAGMSHEIRTPLGTILGYAQVLARTPGQDARQLQAIQGIQRSGAHLLDLLDDLIDLSRREHGRIEPSPTDHDVRETVAAVLDAVRPMAEDKGLMLRVDIARDLPPCVHLDARLVRRIVLNLVSNAVKFTPRGQIAIQVRHADGRLRIAVTDTGPGITADERARLFQPFVQGDAGRRSGRGSGLGLSLSRDLAEAMGGTLTLTDRAMPGSEFVLELPAEPRPARASQLLPALRDMPATTVSPGAEADRAEILICDDRPENLDVLRMILEDAGWQVRAANGGEQALAMIRERRPSVVLMDMRMPEPDGLEVCRRIVADPTTRDLPVIMLSGGGDREERAAAVQVVLNDGANGRILHWGAAHFGIDGVQPKSVPFSF